MFQYSLAEARIWRILSRFGKRCCSLSLHTLLWDNNKSCWKCYKRQC